MPRQEWSFFLPAEDHKEVKWFLSSCQIHITPWGQIILMTSIVGLAVSSVGTQISAYLLPSFILALLTTSFFLSLFSNPKMEAYRILPPSPNAGGHYIYKVVVKNVGKRPARHLEVFEHNLPFGLYLSANHPQFDNTIDWLDPGEQTTVTLVMRTPRRGTFELLPLIIGSSFPSGIIRSIQKVGNQTRFIVYPKLFQQTDFQISSHRTYQPGGISLSSKIGDSNEFASTREYRPGDRLRDIHWSSSARTNKLIVKEYVEEYFTRIGLFVDIELGRFEKHLCFESRISLCAGVAKTINNCDYIIDVFLGNDSCQHLQIGRGNEHFSHLLELLSSIEGDSLVQFHKPLASIRNYSAQLSTLILFLKDWDDKRSAFVQSLKDLNINVTTFIVRDKPATLPINDDTVTIYSPKQLKTVQ